MIPEEFKKYKEYTLERKWDFSDVEHYELTVKLLAALEEAEQQLTKREWMLKESLDIGTRLEGRLTEAKQALDQPKRRLLDAYHNERAHNQHLREINARLKREVEEAQQQRNIAAINYKNYYNETLELAQRLAEAQQTIAHLQDEGCEFEKMHFDQYERAMRLEESLMWYANSLNWEQGEYEGGIFFSLMDRDIGKRARVALGNKEGSDMSQVENFDITDIDGCEFVYSRIVGKMLISWDRDFDGYETGKVRCIYADGSGRPVAEEEAQQKIDCGEWIVYRK
ncbi:hypothetical protein [Paenibacillus donghaensis]|uniref:Uncharacterized protein n=1 Tax=Paenibacillus donghaensis TaxID=414771 RepID=A0A2Z2KAF6_9BACL|nr:hypothetical protein [Paenibacillus donghaensis]ASA22574.1 hypothetical protein B9T62_18365 [Paenibacillus donghaensis]